MENNATQHSTLASVAGLIAAALRSYETDPGPLFAEAGLDISRASDPNTRFPVERMQHLWQLSVDNTGDPCFGLTAARELQPAALQGLGFAWLASDTLHDALSRLVRYSRLISTAADISLEDRGNGIDLLVMPPRGSPEYVYASLDAAVAAFLRMCRITAGDGIKPRCVTLMRPAPPCAERFASEFAAPVSYDAPANQLSFDAAQVDAPLPYANPELARVNDQTIIDYLARFDRSSITLQVRARIIEQLPDGTPHQGDIANALHVSLRSLQRRLQEENTNYKKLLESTRHELALQYIQQSHRSIGEITYLLGFSEPSNFTRAFKRWTGRSPAEFRNLA